MVESKKNENTEIIIQSMVLPNEICDEKELYFRIQKPGALLQKEDSLILEKNAIISTNTYMNCFDIQAWTQYTGITTYKLVIEAQGKGHITLYSLDTNMPIAKCSIDTDTPQKYSIEFQEIGSAHLVYFEVKSEETLCITKASYIAICKEETVNTIHFDLLICTYKRRDEVRALLKQIRQSLFFDKSSSLYGALTIRIIDNASELDTKNDEHVKIYHNPNTGGSGGFTRGILESRKELEKHKTSHVIFMDDDVQMINETLYRLYALLLLATKEYQHRVIAGRMFRMDKKNIQYTACEVWNGGDIRHIGENQDMCQVKHLKQMNHELGEYTGWWFGCFPIDFVNKELPLPFFLHCDDVDYGLRFGKEPLVMNGIQVWHETFENRLSPTIIYYDIRNSLIVNTIHGYFVNEQNAWNWWKQRLWSFYGYIAMLDYLKGKAFFEKYQEKKQLMQMNKLVFRILKPFLWRFLWFRFKREGSRAFESYKMQL